MVIITDLLKDVPLSAVIREKLIDAEKKIFILENENSALKEENKKLKISLNKKDEEIDRLNKIIDVKNDEGPNRFFRT